MTMDSYFLGKLFDINYRMAIHEGNANRRLASEAINIMYQLLPDDVPKLYEKEFLKLRKVIEDTVKNVSSPGLIPVKIHGIQNRTAAKYLKLLIDIEEYMRNDFNL